jgi:glycosyltransferase involved in cell wall biosynthesis
MKRADHLIEVFAAAKLPNTRLLIAGPDDGLTSDVLSALAKKLGVADRVSCLGFVTGRDKWALLAASDLYVSLSWRENFNHTAVEALAMGCPVLLSKGNDLAGRRVLPILGILLLMTRP